MLRTVASQMERLPLSGGRARANANQEAFNQAVGSTFGAKAKKITPDVFAGAKKKLSDQFETLTNRNSLQLNPQLQSDLAMIEAEAGRLATRDTAKVVRGWTKELLGKADANGVIPGKAYQSFDSKLGSVLKGGGEPAHYLGQVRDVVRGAMDNSISAKDRALWA